jgi:hypothetical protein
MHSGSLNHGVTHAVGRWRKTESDKTDKAHAAAPTGTAHPLPQDDGLAATAQERTHALKYSQTQR